MNSIMVLSQCHPSILIVNARSVDERETNQLITETERGNIQKYK